MDAKWQGWTEYDEPHMAHVKAILVDICLKSVTFAPEETERVTALLTRKSYADLMEIRNAQIGVDLAEYGDYGDYSAYASLSPNAEEIYHDLRACGVEHFKAYLTASGMYPRL